MKKLTFFLALFVLCLSLSACQSKQIDDLTSQVESLQRKCDSLREDNYSLEVEIAKKDLEIERLSNDLSTYEKNCICDELEKCSNCSAVGKDAFFEFDDGDRYCTFCMLDFLFEIEDMMIPCSACGAPASRDALLYVEEDLLVCGNCVFDALNTD